jgi:hypothetical protein
MGIVVKVEFETKLDGAGRRFYIDTSGRLPPAPSVTTILSKKSPFPHTGPTAITWTGEMVHYHILHHELPEVEMDYPDVLPTWKMPKFDETNYKLELALKMWNSMDSSLREVEDVEFVCWNIDPLYAGRGDWKGKYNGDKTILDIKTGNYYSYYKMQIAAYMATQGADRGVIVRLDLNEERNPKKEPKIYSWYKEDLAKDLEKFYELARSF